MNISITDFTQCTATELADFYRTGSVSPVTVAEQVLVKIARVNPVLNAFCFTDPATTLKQAEASAQRWRQGQPLSELDGVPVAVKDSILTQGWPTRYASHAVEANQSWSEDAPAVARLREAGAIFVGKTTMSEFGSSPHNSDSLLYGKVHNPWNLEYSPGGSSGGSAVAVAAGLVPIALGTDFGGSIAFPSSFCGVVGMKPSTGRIPQYPVDVLELVTVGCMARSTVDIAMIMNIIAKSDIRDSTALPCDHTKYNLMVDYSLRGKKIACVNGQISPEIFKYLLSQGAQVDFISLDFASAEKILDKLSETKVLHQWLSIPDQLKSLTSRVVQHRAILAHNPEITYSQLKKRHELIAHMRKFMQSYDVLLAPAITIDLNKPPSDLVDQLFLWVKFCCLTKQPTIIVPIGTGSNGMPQSIMLAGAMHDDIGMLQVAHAIEKQFPMPHPPLFYSKGSLCKNEILNNA